MNSSGSSALTVKEGELTRADQQWRDLDPAVPQQHPATENINSASHIYAATALALQLENQFSSNSDLADGASWQRLD